MRTVIKFIDAAVAMFSGGQKMKHAFFDTREAALAWIDAERAAGSAKPR